MTNKRKLSDLALDSGNANKGTERGRQAIEASIREFGFADAGTLDCHNTLIGGNKRTIAAGAIGMDEAIIIDVDGTQPIYIRRNDLDLSSTEDDRARRLAYALNRSQQLSLEWDAEQMLADLNAGFDLSSLWRQDELDEMLADLQPKGTEGDTEPQVDRADELRQKWGVEPGQLWQLGEHRLICGDCTDAAVVARVMAGEKADLFLTDPPYGVSYADKNKWLNAIAKGNRIQTPIENDHGDMAQTAKNIWLPAFSLALECCYDTSSFYLFMPQGGDQMMMMMMMMNESGWNPRHELIWLKNNHVLGRADYNYKHEPILYGWKRKGTHKFYGDFQTSVIECNKPSNSDLHPTTKPIELINRLIPNNTQGDSIVYDPFSGSGTTLIACEQLGRRCRAVEISPAYVGVALERFHMATGKMPQLVTE